MSALYLSLVMSLQRQNSSSHYFGLVFWFWFGWPDCQKETLNNASWAIYIDTVEGAD